jgi:hypothetical protein
MRDKGGFRAAVILILAGLASVPVPAVGAQEGTVPAFDFEPCAIRLSRPARPGTHFDKVGRKFAVLGSEDGSFEAWAWPLKLFRDFRFSFLLGSSTVPVEGRDVARFLDVTPSRTTVTFVHQAFTVRAHYVAAIDEPGAIILLEVDASEPLSIVAGFLPALQPMWPAGLGGQYAYWDDAIKAYVISESTRKNNGLVGSPAARGISYTPAHMLSDVPNQFKIAVDKPEDVKGRYIPVVMAGGKGSRDVVIDVYQRLAAGPESVCRAAEKHYADLLASTLRVRTPDPDLDLAFAWAGIGYDNLVVDNPDLGRGLVAGLGPSGTGGRPGFGWFFGGDAFINVLSLNSLGNTAAAKEALAFSRKWQRKDGKMAHELSQAAGYIDWWGEYPYGYIHGDTTPFYVVAMDSYYEKTGDLEFVRSSWESLKKAYTWCPATDEDGDGLMDNAKAGLGALEFGSLTGIRTDIYLAAVWARACEGMERLARAAGDAALSKKAGVDHARAAAAIKRRFWDGEKKSYAHAIDMAGGLVRELTPWSAVGLMWGLGGPEETASTLERIGAAELATDWGVRTLSDKSALYEPLNYNYGAVWPFLTGWVAAAQYENDRPVPGYGSLMSSVRHTFDNALGAVTEVFSGARNIWPAEAVPHQGFSGGSVVLPFVVGLLGLEGSAPEKRISFEPRFPADWEGVSAEGFKVGEADAAVRYARSEGKVMAVVTSSAPAGWRMTFRPSFGPGTKILSASVNGKQAAFVDAGPATLAVRPSVEFPLMGKDTVEIGFEPTVEILPPTAVARTGDADRGLKVIRVELSAPEDGLEVIVEGLAGETYELPLARSDKVSVVEGAELAGKGLIFRMPGTSGAGFVRHTIRISLD